MVEIFRLPTEKRTPHKHSFTHIVPKSHELQGNETDLTLVKNISV